MLNLFSMYNHYPKIIENDEIDWHIDDAIKMNTTEWIDFDSVDMDKLEKLLDEYLNESLNKNGSDVNELVDKNEEI